MDGQIGVEPIFSTFKALLPAIRRLTNKMEGPRNFEILTRRLKASCSASELRAHKWLFVWDLHPLSWSYQDRACLYKLPNNKLVVDIGIEPIKTR